MEWVKCREMWKTWVFDKAIFLRLLLEKSRKIKAVEKSHGQIL